MTVQHGDDAQHVFIILIIAYGFGVGIEERNILVLQKIFAELIDVNRLVITADIGIVKGLFRYEVYDITVLVYLHHRSVHP